MIMIMTMMLPPIGGIVSSIVHNRDEKWKYAEIRKLGSVPTSAMEIARNIYDKDNVACSLN